MAVATTTNGASENGAAPRYSDIGPRVGSLERSVAVLDTDMKEVKVSLSTLAAGQDKLSTILLRMEAAESERAKHPRTPWWQIVAGMSAVFGLIAVLANVESYIFRAQVSDAIAPIVSEHKQDALSAAYDLKTLDTRLKHVESAISWVPAIRSGLIDNGVREAFR